METVSVIIPVYNVERYIERCLDSVTAQTHTALEIIIIDDGSTDSSGEICDSYARRDERISVIHIENGGLSMARNAGLDKATGDYILFVDSDDYIAYDTVEFLLAMLHEHDADMTACAYVTVDEIRNHTEQKKLTFTEGVVSPEEYWELIYSDMHTYFVVIWGKLYRRSLWVDVRFPVGKLHEDEFVIHKFVEKCSKIFISKNPLYFYVRREGSIMNSEYSEKNLDAAEAMLLRGIYFTDNGDYANAVKALEMAMYSLVRGYQHIGGTERVMELHNTFCRLYKRLPKNYFDKKLRLKCIVCSKNLKLFSLLKKGGN